MRLNKKWAYWLFWMGIILAHLLLFAIAYAFDMLGELLMAMVVGAVVAGVYHAACETN